MSVLVAVLLTSQFGARGPGSVLWEWYSSDEDCLAGNGVLHHEWSQSRECLRSADLDATDPLRKMAAAWSSDADLNVRVTCVDPHGDSANFNAADDIVNIDFFNSTDTLCSAMSLHTIMLKNSECGVNATFSSAPLADIRLAKYTCSRCTWVFLNESPPPYFVQAVGIFVFLIACMFLNFCLQDRLDRWGKTLPPRLLPCWFNKKETGDLHAIEPGVTVLVKSRNKENPARSSFTHRELNTTYPGKKGLIHSGSTEKLSSDAIRLLDAPRPERRRRRRLPPIGAIPLSPISSEQSLHVRQGHRGLSATLGSLNSPATPGESHFDMRSPSSLSLHPAEAQFNSDTWSHHDQEGLLLGTPRELEDVFVVHAYTEHMTSKQDVLLGATPMCTVCGREGVKGEERHHGYKCETCFGKEHNPLLYRADDLLDEDVTEMACRGVFGRFADVVGLRRASDGHQQLLLAFRRSVAWLRREVVPSSPTNSLGSGNLTEDDIPNIRIMSKKEEALWVKYCKSHGFKVTKSSDSLQAVMILQPILAWVKQNNVKKIADWGGQYARVAEKDVLKQHCGQNWKKWWADFELCVGEVLRIRQDPASSGQCRAVISFKGSATLVLPIAALLSCSQEEHDAEVLITPQRVERRTMMAVFVASAPPLLAAKGLFLMVFFAISVVTALSDGHSGRANHHSAWEAYEEVYFKLFNSGYPTLMADCGSVTIYFLYAFQPTFPQFVSGVGKPVIVTLALSLMISLPGIITHAFPMVMYYCWMWVPVGVLLRGSAELIMKWTPEPPEVDNDHAFDMFYFMKKHKSYLIRAGLFYVTFRFMAELVAVIFVQTNFNYAIYAYEGTGYFETIQKEFNSRQVACILEMGLKLASLMW